MPIFVFFPPFREEYKKKGMAEMKIIGKNVVLTGASSGIGLEMLKLLAKEKTNKILAVSRHAVQLLSYYAENVIPFDADLGSAAGVDAVFEKAGECFGGGKIDLFFANAGFGYYEDFNYTDWGRMTDLFSTDVFSPMYAYAEYRRHLGGREGTFVITGSAIGLVALPGYALYSAGKFALNGFRQAVRLEKPTSLRLVFAWPIAADTPFYRKACPLPIRKPFPLQSAETAAKKIVDGIERGRNNISTSAAFTLFYNVSHVLRPLREIYLAGETRKFIEFKRKF